MAARRVLTGVLRLRGRWGRRWGLAGCGGRKGGLSTQGWQHVSWAPGGLPSSPREGLSETSPVPCVSLHP